MLSSSLAPECVSRCENYLLKPGKIKGIFLVVNLFIIIFLTGRSQHLFPCGTDLTVKEQPYLKNPFIKGPEESGETVRNFYFQN